MSLKENINKLFISKIKSYIIQSNYKTVVARLSKEIKTRKLKVVFINSECAKWSYQSLYDEMKNSKYFEPMVLISVRKTLLKKKYDFLNFKKTIQDNYQFFKRNGINVKYAFDLQNEKYIDLKKFKPDIIFYEQPWDLDKTLSIFNTSKYSLSFYCSYGSCISNGDNEYSQPFFIDVYTYFLDNDCIEKILLQHGCKEKSLKVVGQLKLDAYRKPVDTSNILWKSKYKKRIIYAPHHSFYKSSTLGYGTFDWNYKYLYKFAEEHPEYEFILKPHPDLKRQIIRNKLMTFDEMNTYFKKWESLNNAQIYESSNYFDTFRSSDLLITDCNSFLYEYLPTNKPIIHLISSHSVGHNEFGEKIIQGYYPAKSIEELENYLNLILKEGVDPLFERRNKIIKNILQQPEIGVANTIINHLESILTSDGGKLTV